MRLALARLLPALRLPVDAVHPQIHLIIIRGLEQIVSTILQSKIKIKLYIEDNFELFKDHF